LTPTERKLVQSQLYDREVTPATARTAVNKPGQEWITLISLHTLRPGTYLNDEAVSTYLRLLNTRDKIRTTATKTRPCHCFPTFLVTMLLQNDHGQAPNYSYDLVRRWSRHVPGKSLFLLDKIIFPINVNGNHWVCVMVSIPDRKIQYHDSLGGDGRIFLESILQYLKDDHRYHNHTELPGDWSQSLIAGPETNTPKQANSFDCGVFVCAIADCLMRGQSLDFTQHQLAGFRDHIALALLQGSVPGWNVPFLQGIPNATTPQHRSS